MEKKRNGKRKDRKREKERKRDKKNERTMIKTAQGERKRDTELKDSTQGKTEVKKG